MSFNFYLGSLHLRADNVSSTTEEKRTGVDIRRCENVFESERGGSKRTRSA